MQKGALRNVVTRKKKNRVQTLRTGGRSGLRGRDSKGGGGGGTVAKKIILEKSEGELKEREKRSLLGSTGGDSWVSIAGGRGDIARGDMEKTRVPMNGHHGDFEAYGVRTC